jgi:hypothetical protein
MNSGTTASVHNRKAPGTPATICDIYIVEDSALKARGWNLAWLLRHELAHCNGWAGHAGGKKIWIGTPTADGEALAINVPVGETRVLEWPEGEATITLTLEDVLELQKHLPLLKKCNAFWQCVADRDAGKVKHCYENDRRWR